MEAQTQDEMKAKQLVWHHNLSGMNGDSQAVHETAKPTSLNIISLVSCDKYQQVNTLSKSPAQWCEQIELCLSLPRIPRMLKRVEEVVTKWIHLCYVVAPGEMFKFQAT